MTSRSIFLAAAGAATGVAALATAVGPARAATAFDRHAFEARIRAPFAHRQVFGSGSVADGALFGFMKNSLDAYETGFGEGPGTLHAAAVLYHTAVVFALNDDAWNTYDIARFVRGRDDRTAATAGGW